MWKAYLASSKASITFALVRVVNSPNVHLRLPVPCDPHVPAGGSCGGNPFRAVRALEWIRHDVRHHVVRDQCSWTLALCRLRLYQ